MSTCYQFADPIPLETIIQNLPEGIEYHKKKDVEYLTDGTSYLHIDHNDETVGLTTVGLTRYGPNNVHEMIQALEEKHNTNIFSEHEEEYFRVFLWTKSRSWNTNTYEHKTQLTRTTPKAHSWADNWPNSISWNQIQE